MVARIGGVVTGRASASDGCWIAKRSLVVDAGNARDHDGLGIKKRLPSGNRRTGLHDGIPSQTVPRIIDIKYDRVKGRIRLAVIKKVIDANIKHLVRQVEGSAFCPHAI